MTQTDTDVQLPGAGKPGSGQQYPLGPSTLDADVYRDPARYQQELKHVLFEGWYPAVPAADLPNPRDYVVWDQLEQSVAITRLDDGTVSAWHNVCQHRGARLLDGAGHCKRGRLTCPWHGFSYDLTGAVRGVPMPETFDKQRLEGLRAPAVRAVEWGGWIWLTLSGRAPDLLAYLGVIGEELGRYGLDTYSVQYRHSVTLQANWKIVIDAFNETWHVPFTHPETLAGSVLWREATLKIEPPHSWMTLPVRGLTDRATSQDHQQRNICHYLAFPNTIFSCFPTHLQMWSAWPLSADETLLCAYQMAGPPPAGVPADKWARRNERDWAAFQEVLLEDADVVNGFTKIARSLGFRQNMFNTAEGRLTAFHHEIAERVNRGEEAS